MFMRIDTYRLGLLGALIWLGCMGASALGQVGLAKGPGREALAESPITPHFGLQDVRPNVHKWYVPRHLPQRFDTPWYITDSNYAQQLHLRYVNETLEGEQWYDGFGRPVERGWLLYEWNQVQEDTKGSSVWKGRQYSSLFRNLVIAQDGDGRGDYRLMVGDQIYTMFTPLTFNKPRFSGMRLDYASDHFLSSLILSRPSNPNGDNISGTLRPSARTDFTNLFGGHALVQLSERFNMGLTYVNAHMGQTKQELGEGSPFSGSLTVDQNKPLENIWVRLRDDSPEDGRGGALLFDYDVVLVDTSGRQLRGSEIGFLPTVEGGISRGDNLAADGSEIILINYNLDEWAFDEVETDDLRRVSIELAVANDYRIEMASDRQTDGELRRARPVFLTVHRAAGNVQDNSNVTVLEVDYGLPTATELIGLNWNLVDWHGLSVQGEAVLNRRHRYYPNPGIKHRHRAIEQAEAAYIQVAFDAYPWSLFAEAFTLDDNYSTSAWLAGTGGQVLYNDPTQALYELVDDDDDFNAVPEWSRRFQGGSDRAWPGYDENIDFLHDYNQNANQLPDYDEPFLRFRSDRPEFLPGLDMNYNGTIDRFENDQLPDYPYKTDHRGVNAYGTVYAGPDRSLTLGVQRMELIAGDGETHSEYALLRWVEKLPGPGYFRLFEHASRVRDTIVDPLRQWIQPTGLDGRMREVIDLLPAQDAYMHLFYADLDHQVGPQIRFWHRLRWDAAWQQQKDEVLQEREARQRSGFFGIIDKAEWSIPVGLAVLKPRWKSEYRKQRPFSRRQPVAESLEETFFLLWSQPLMSESTTVGYFPRYGRQLFNTHLEVGLEYSWFRLLEGRYEEVDEDFSSWTLVTQFINRTAYQGYQLITRTGLQIGRRRFAESRTQRRNLFFVTINAGLE
ncbi:MAG: hypothetical protein GKR89_21225 [Candidatus Latescibacteria bacterium]|nr:hypothetical protein [Candidatus Latescibacterota bacterium]